jgi:hypothetical protein
LNKKYPEAYTSGKLFLFYSYPNLTNLSFSVVQMNVNQHDSLDDEDDDDLASLMVCTNRLF